MKTITFISIAIILLLSACENLPGLSNTVVIGKNGFSTTVDGDTREYFVHVPTGYDASRPSPVVFMLHGTSGDGNRFYNISGWKEVGDAENILTVFPSSWRHCIIDDGQVSNTTKWNVYPGSFTYCSGEVPRDDIKFLRQIIQELNVRYNIDERKMYLAGFSNGGAMAFRCAVEMSDVFAAIVEASGSVAGDTILVPRRQLPISFQVGSLESLIPMDSFEFALNTVPRFRELIRSHASTFALDTNYTVSGSVNNVLRAKFEALPMATNHEFNIMLIKGMEHNYPNGNNHPMKGAEVHWAWFQQYTLP